MLYNLFKVCVNYPVNHQGVSHKGRECSKSFQFLVGSGIVPV